MGNQCFTCKYKLTREISPDVNEYACKVSGAIIHQTDKACRYFSPDPALVKIKNSLRKVAGELLRGIRQ